tara:strand:- start:222 stop:1124 length:903 start_codon:yes stop_codon:yes gene_type:complete
MNNPHNLTLELASPKGIYLDIIPEGQQFPPPPPPPRPKKLSIQEEFEKDLKKRGMIPLSIPPSAKPGDRRYTNFTKLWSLAIEGRCGRRERGKPLPGKWATEKDKIYTPKDSGCIPNLEEIMAIKKTGIKLYGKIVMKNGVIFNADAERELESMDQKKKKEYLDHYMEQFEKYYKLRKSSGKLWPDDNKDLWYHNKSSPNTIDISPGEHNFPSGTYHLNEESSHDPDSEIEGVKLCDNHKCCISSHIALELAMNGHTYSKEIIKFHKNRPIYTKKDEFNGNFDICYFCINNLPSGNVSTI